ncbi:MAG: hypothetical protein LBR58_04180 [Propionibacteriaceae bacterium]|jgi:DNA topoisomerase IA|nr:hypothetical protein [Propionibacteriaceae bacterium]
MTIWADKEKTRAYPEAMGRMLSENLRKAAEGISDPQLRAAMEDAANGKISLRDLTEQRGMEELMVSGLKRYKAAVDELSEEQRKATQEAAAQEAIRLGLVQPEDVAKLPVDWLPKKDAE